METEFKNKLINVVWEQLGVKYNINSSPYRPQTNGRIESFHFFLKACISKHITPKIEWDDVVPLACAAYNFLPNEHSKESPFLPYVWKRYNFTYLINYCNHRCNILAMMRISCQCKHLKIFMRW